jgi:membrane-associated phospholipid phosphatase
MRPQTGFLTLSLLLGILGPAAAPAQQTQARYSSVSLRWNRLVPKLVEQSAANRRKARAAAAAAKDSAALRRIAQTPEPFLFRVYSLLGIAQYAALEDSRHNSAVTRAGVVAAASAAVLADQFTDTAVRRTITLELEEDIGQAGAGDERALASKRLGEDIARRVIAWSPKANLFQPWGGTIPTGPGKWYSAPRVPPIGIAFASSRTWVLDSASQFRPAPPPAFDSPEWRASLEEVKAIARNRTREQSEIARRWDASDPWEIWTQKAADAIRRRRMPEDQVVKVLALLNVAASDAIIACFDAKYHYWTIRPSQADTTLALADSVGLPNFPSYPSGHSCSAGAFNAVLGHFFPEERAEFERVATEQAMSRLYGGIHYRFDNDVGLALGRAVAMYAIDRERRGGLNAWRNAQL